MSNFINDSSKNYLIFNQFYELDNKLYDFKKTNFIYSVHCPFSANYSNRITFESFSKHKIFGTFFKIFKEIKSVQQIQNRITQQ